MATTGTDDAITFVISVAAELAGVHPQALRRYDRLGLVIPAHQGAGAPPTARRAAPARRAADEPGGISLATSDASSKRAARGRGRWRQDALRGAVAAAEAKRNRVFAASADGQVMPMRRGQRPWIVP